MGRFAVDFSPIAEGVEKFKEKKILQQVEGLLNKRQGMETDTDEQLRKQHQLMADTPENDQTENLQGLAALKEKKSTFKANKYDMQGGLDDATLRSVSPAARQMYFSEIDSQKERHIKQKNEDQQKALIKYKAHKDNPAVLVDFINKYHADDLGLPEGVDNIVRDSSGRVKIYEAGQENPTYDMDQGQANKFFMGVIDPANLEALGKGENAAFVKSEIVSQTVALALMKDHTVRRRMEDAEIDLEDPASYSKQLAFVRNPNNTEDIVSSRDFMKANGIDTTDFKFSKFYTGEDDKGHGILTKGKKVLDVELEPERGAGKSKSAGGDPEKTAKWLSTEATKKAGSALSEVKTHLGNLVTQAQINMDMDNIDGASPDILLNKVQEAFSKLDKMKKDLKDDPDRLDSVNRIEKQMRLALTEVDKFNKEGHKWYEVVASGERGRRGIEVGEQTTDRGVEGERQQLATGISKIGKKKSKKVKSTRQKVKDIVSSGDTEGYQEGVTDLEERRKERDFYVGPELGSRSGGMDILGSGGNQDWKKFLNK